jgi:hypothetical protein
MRTILLALSALLLAALAGCSLPPAQGVDDAPTAPQALLYGTPPFATTIVEKLVVAPAHPQGYERDADFGSGWADPDHNGCDAREDTMIRDFVTYQAGPGCKVLSGSFSDPYTGTMFPYSSAKPSAVQIDHLVALKAAWSGGAWRWTPAERVAYANEPRVLRASQGSANASKGDRLPGPLPRGWLPVKGFDCQYTAEVLRVLDHYKLTVTSVQKQDLRDVVKGCAGLRVPTWG